MAKPLTVILGAILVLLGFLGFVSNPLIGVNALFAADALQNVIHIVLGAFSLIIAFRFTDHAELWLKVIGGATFLVGLIGVLTVPATGGSLLGMGYTNGASSWFYVIIGAVVFLAPIFNTDERLASQKH